MTQSREHAFPFLGVLGAWAAFSTLRWLCLDLPLDRDEGELATLAWLWRSEHGVPYRDWLHQKPPLGIALALLGQLWRTDGVEGLRLVAWVWTSLSLWAFVGLAYGLGARCVARTGISPRRWALGAAWVFAALASGARSQALSASTESFLILPAILAVACWALPERPGRWSALAAGSWLGLASLAKPVALPLLLLPWLHKPAALPRWRAALWMALGAAWPWALVLGGMAHAAAAAALWDCAINYNLAYAAQGATGAMNRAWGLSRWLAPELGLAALFAGWGFWCLRGSRASWLLWAWLLAALLGLAAGGRYYPHYSLLLLAPLALAAAAGLAALPRWAGNLGAAGILLSVSISAWPVWSASSGPERSQRLFGTTLMAQGRELGVLIAQRSGPGERLFIWGSEAELYYYSQRVPATRFLYHYPFTGEAPAWPEGDAELIAGLRDPRTRVAVLTQGLDRERSPQRDLIETLDDSYSPLPSRPGAIVALRHD